MFAVTRQTEPDTWTWAEFDADADADPVLYDTRAEAEAAMRRLKGDSVDRYAVAEGDEVYGFRR